MLAPKSMASCSEFFPRKYADASILRLNECFQEGNFYLNVSTNDDACITLASNFKPCFGCTWNSLVRT